MKPFDINDDDRDLARRLHDLTDKQLFEAEKLYYRSSMSYLAAARTIKNRGGA